MFMAHSLLITHYLKLLLYVIPTDPEKLVIGGFNLRMLILRVSISGNCC